MKVKDAMYDGRHYGLTTEEVCSNYNHEAGLHHLNHWAYPRGKQVMLIRHPEGPKIVDRWELIEFLNELRHARLGSVEA